ncbi:NADH-quinone oxidoreductase subunit C [Sphingobacterium chuzhouense]|uniref:NADH-quinone oxidoreductase subunit C n=1 Tax=Sphingobacterium chuzhouense TaxID=1742264 RepID=A0ABR7XUU3_9SPHI|nr:NADH-quinone oxidoreductase subunit C [Sphingobacterium chuzhouense]MBD1422827.1 NADH-quinone oxidoreductase subunit C [Sphingobacterium chuzhouense]
MITEIKDLITTHIGEQAIVRIEEEHLHPILVINDSDLVKIAFLLRDTEGYYFDFLSNISTLDYYPDYRFAVVYHLSSIPYQTQLTLKVEIENDRRLDNLPEIPSVSAVWRTADWHEREAFDLMGIFFTEHPDLRRILLPDDWQGYPLRKDYEDAETYHGIAIK